MRSPNPRPALLRLLLLLPLLAIMSWRCDFPSGEPLPNTMPDTRLANVPANDTIAQYILQGVIPEQTLYWAGDDPDGYVVAYKLRWIDFVGTRPETTQWRTILNLTAFAGTALDTLIEVHPGASSLYRIYNYFATVGASASEDFLSALQDSIAKGTYFPVPYPSGFVEGDSVKGANPIQIEAPTKANFIFFSPADSNRHRFEVKAVDNSDAEDPTPAVVNFWTLRSTGPVITDIAGPGLGIARYIIRCPTERSPGLFFTISALDKTTQEREYSYAVDDSVDSWQPWQRSPVVVVTAAMLQETGTDTHTIYVRARNRWGVISRTYGEIFRAIIPEIDNPGWPKRLLVLINSKLTGAGAIDSTAIKDFYSTALDAAGLAGRYDFWVRYRAGTSDFFPPRSVFSKYTALLLSVENAINPPRDGAGWRIGGSQQDNIREYLAYGGNLIWSGTPYITRYFEGGGFNNFARTIFHLDPTTYQTNTELDFVGVTGRAGYPSAYIDSTKVGADSSYAIRGIGVYGSVISFGIKTSTFVSGSGSVFFDGLPVSSAYYAPPADPGPFCRRTYSGVYFGYPLYYMRPADAAAALTRALRDVGELP